MGNSCMIVNAGKVQECVCGWLKTYSGLGEWEPHSVSAIYGITPGKEEQWACVINEKKQRNALWSTKISDGFGPMSSQNLKRDLTDPSGPRGGRATMSVSSSILGHPLNECTAEGKIHTRCANTALRQAFLTLHSKKTTNPISTDLQISFYLQDVKTSRLKDKS